MIKILKDIIFKLLDNQIQESIKNIYTEDTQISVSINNYSRYKCVNELLNKIK